MEPPAKRNKERDPSNTVTSFSVNRDLLKEAQDWAMEERRTVSNLIGVLLEREILARKKRRERGENK